MKQLLFIIALFSTFSLHAQLDDLVKHWTFDKNTGNQDYYSLINSTSEVLFSDGIVDKSLLMKGQDYYLDFQGHLNVNSAFSIVFWFKVDNVNDIETLLLQEKINTKDGEIKRYFQVGIYKGKLAIKDEKSDWQSYSSTNIEPTKWYQLTYTYDEIDLQIFLDEKKIHTSNEVTIFGKTYDDDDKLYLGKAANNAVKFNGYIDEIMTFDEGVDKDIVTDIYNIGKMYIPKEVIDTTPPIIIIDDEPVEPPPVLKNSLPIKTTSRINELQDSITVETTDIQFEIWDYDEFDNDKVYFILNNSKPFYTNSILNKKRKAVKHSLPPTIKLKTNDDNYLIFYAEDMGKYPSQNTAGVRIWLDGKPQNDKIYKFELTEEKNAVLKIIHKEEPDEELAVVESENTENETPPEQKKEISETSKEIKPKKGSKNKHKLTISDTMITISVMDNLIVDGDSVTILHNGKPILSNHGLTKTLHSVSAKLVQNETNIFTFVPVSMGSKNTQNTAFVIIKADGKVIDEVTLSSLNKNQPAKLIIVHKTEE